MSFFRLESPDTIFVDQLCRALPNSGDRCRPEECCLLLSKPTLTAISQGACYRPITVIRMLVSMTHERALLHMTSVVSSFAVGERLAER
mgnify:CR=1 FL=1